MKSQLLLPVFGTALALVAPEALAQSWSLTGEAGLTDANFLGTLDLHPLELRVNNQRVMRFAPSTEPTQATAAAVNIIGGWRENYVSPDSSAATIVGGGSLDYENLIDSGDYSVIAGGSGNSIQSTHGSIGGGSENSIGSDAWAASVNGGRQNQIGNSANSSTISGGWSNIIGGACFSATIGGGRRNIIVNSSPGAVVAGGYFNRIDGGADFATISGGNGNTIPSNRGNYAMIPGGLANVADGHCSLAAGRGAQALHNGTFVWADYTEADFVSTGQHQFLIRAGGGVGINTTSPDAALDVNGEIHCTVLELTSDRNAKTGFENITPRDILARVAQLPLATWQYTNAPSVRHIGPMAQDFKAAFPSIGADDTHIASVDADGVALASIQALHEMVEDKDERIATLEEEVARLKQELTGLKGDVADRLAALEKVLPGDTLQTAARSVASP